MIRRTIVVEEKLAAREARLCAARGNAHGLQAISFEQVAARLAGGLLRPVDQGSLRLAVDQALADHETGDLASISDLPGTAGAVAGSIRKAWLAGIDPGALADRHPRLAELAKIESAATAALPTGMLTPRDLAARALARIGNAPAVLGEVELHALRDLAPCWRPLLGALAERVPVTWCAGPRHLPDWLEGVGVTVTVSRPETPAVQLVSAGSERHEVTEALRWARWLLAQGTARPEDIAIAAVDPSAYDEFVLALRREANLDIAFADGVPALATRDGQTAAALADALVRGPDQTRIRRLAALAGGSGLFARLPLGWQRVMPHSAALTEASDWRRLLDRLTPADWPEAKDAGAELAGIVTLLQRGAEAAAEAGEAFLAGAALALWRDALRRAGPNGMQRALADARTEDKHEPCSSIAWVRASALAAAPRPFVRLLGLSAASWPRRAGEDPILPERVVPSRELEPLSRPAADRRDFAAIIATTARELTLSRPRRDAQGRLLGPSPLLRGLGPEIRLRRDRRPEHAVSETDRLAGRPSEFGETDAARSGLRCWTEWQRDVLTPHDGVVRPEHPALEAALARRQSASSLSLLVRNPIGFAWRYALGLREPEIGAQPITLPPPDFGTLVHEVLERAVVRLERGGGLAGADAHQIETVLDESCWEAARAWSEVQGTPPQVVWRRTLEDVRSLAAAALAKRGDSLPGQTSYAEVPFGGQSGEDGRETPWDGGREVHVPGTPFRIGGYIDRLDLAADRSAARVVDYKTGRVKPEGIVLDGGRELQRCLYSYAVTDLLGEQVEVEADLLFLRGPEVRRLERGSEALRTLGRALSLMHGRLRAGLAVPGTDAGDERDKMRFALPANATGGYCRRKSEAATGALGEAATIWEAE